MLDPYGKIPGFKYSAVRVEPAEGEPTPTGNGVPSRIGAVKRHPLHHALAVDLGSVGPEVFEETAGVLQERRLAGGAEEPVAGAHAVERLDA